MRKTLTPLLAALTLMLGLTATSSVQAGEAIEPLRGAWVIESFNGEQFPPNLKATMTFVDDDTISLSVSMDGQVIESQENRYAATNDGKITIFEDDGSAEEGKWEVKADGKLYLSGPNDDGEIETLILRRP
ncbi:MAG: hypothetical protein AAGC44_10390 [Planctomycetota bacterium]